MIKSDTRPIQPVNQYLLNQQIARFCDKGGWRVVSQTETAVQMCKPKEWNVAMLGIGTAGLLVGFGIIFLILAVLDYALKGDMIVYFTAGDVARGDIPIPTEPFNWLLFGAGIFFSVAFFACAVLAI